MADIGNTDNRRGALNSMKAEQAARNAEAGPRPACRTDSLFGKMGVAMDGANTLSNLITVAHVVPVAGAVIDAASGAINVGKKLFDGKPGAAAAEAVTSAADTFVSTIAGGLGGDGARELIRGGLSATGMKEKTLPETSPAGDLIREAKCHLDKAPIRRMQADKFSHNIG